MNQLPPPPPGCADWRDAYDRLRRYLDAHNRPLELPEIASIDYGAYSYSPAAIACYAAEEQRRLPARPPAAEPLTAQDISDLLHAVSAANYNTEKRGPQLMDKLRAMLSRAIAPMLLAAALLATGCRTAQTKQYKPETAQPSRTKV